MVTRAKTRPIQDSFAEALHSEMVAGTENLGIWLQHIQAQKSSDTLFELESWLKGLRAFFDLRFVPMSDTERPDLVKRDFAPELRIVRLGIQACERCASELACLGQPETMEYDVAIEQEMRRETILDIHLSRMLQQSTPEDSLVRLMESLNDLRVMVDAFDESRSASCQIFLSLGRAFDRDLKSCRYIDMLLSQRFRRQHDRVDHPALSIAVRNISDDSLRRNLALALLYLHRFLKYLKLIERDLFRDQPLRRTLILFALLQEEMRYCVDFMRSRFLKSSEVPSSIRSAVDLIIYSLRSESKRVLQKELVFASREHDASKFYERVENSHGLLRNSCEAAIAALAKSLDEKFDPALLFPSMAQSQQRAQRLREELWKLRHYIRGMLETKGALDFDGMIRRVAEFRESSLHDLMFKDWNEFEVFSDSLMIAGSDLEVRTLLRQFVSYLETLVQEVSNRSVLKGSVEDTPSGS